LLAPAKAIALDRVLFRASFHHGSGLQQYLSTDFIGMAGATLNLAERAR
jgi:hypothetical protein